MDPFDVLEISERANDQDVRDAYLEKVRRYPPDRFPDEFQEIRAAFDALKDEKSRVRTRVFGNGQIQRFSELIKEMHLRPSVVGAGLWLSVLAEKES